MDTENMAHLNNVILFSYNELTHEFAGKWMELENIILIKVSQTLKEIHCYVLTDKWTIAKK
jgi:hypothetical protein